MTSTPLPDPSLAIVAIGRNEGERMRACLRSCQLQASTIVYVDSGSTDDSVAFARSIGVEVVELDMSVPFTAARARNFGLARARQLEPELRWVQFVDADCQLVEGWIERAQRRALEAPRLAVVCGRRRERFRGKTIYNRLCDIEWNTPVGPARASGGDALMRVDAFLEVGGFRESMIAGEEPELCFRLRAAGWHVERIDADMTLHDADITRFTQWWKRAERAGHAFAEFALLHGGSAERPGVKETASSVAWSVLAGAMVALPPLAPLGLGAAAVTSARVYRSMRSRGYDAGDAAAYAASCLIAKVPQAIGAGKLAYRRALGRRSTLLEYK